MTVVRQYSKLFTCLYDEPEPVGSLGRGTHYSVFRAVEWLDVTRQPLQLPQIHDFAVIWDEDHDERVIDAVEQIYMAGLLSPIQFIGERKGGLTTIVAARYYFSGSEADTETYRRAVEAIAQDQSDPWHAMLGSFDRSPGSPHQNFFEGIINDSEQKVWLYLANIDSLWRLGTHVYRPTVEASHWGGPPMPPVGMSGEFPSPSRPPSSFPPGGILPPVVGR